MKLALSVAAFVAALVLAAPTLAAHPPVKKWSKMTLTERRAYVTQTIHADQTAIRWWLAHRPRGPLVRTLDAFAPIKPIPFCKTLGIRAPTGVCAHALHLPRAVATLAEIDRQIQMTITPTFTWTSAVRAMQGAYPGTESWVLSCSSSEGGWGNWKWRNPYGYASFREGVPLNDAGNIPGGPMQYFEGTFWGDFNSAWRDLTDRGYLINGTIRDPATGVHVASWFSIMGQAIAATWAAGHNRPSGKWTGGRC